MNRLIVAGHSGIDAELEDIVAGYSGGQGSVKFGQYVVAPAENGDYYLGEIDSIANNGIVTLALDGKKKDFKYFKLMAEQELLQELNKKLSAAATTLNQLLENNKDRIVRAKKTTRTFGQGAFNTHYGHLVFDQGVKSGGGGGLELALIALYYSKEVEAQLGKKAKESNTTNKYNPLSKQHGIPVNANIGGLFSEKITLRVDIGKFDGLHIPSDHIINEIDSGDFLFFNSVKDTAYAALLLEKIVEKKPHVYLYATDSMIDKLGKGMVNRILAHSEVYFARLDELGVLSGIKGLEKDEGKLKEAMMEIKERMNGGKDGKGRVYITFDDKGSFALDEDNQFYFYPVSKLYKPLSSPIKNQSGCGDGFGAIASYLEALRTIDKKKYGYNTAEILGYASIAGQIKARMRDPSGDASATPERINQFLEEHYDDVAYLRKYSQDNREGHNSEYRFHQIDKLPKLSPNLKREV